MQGKVELESSASAVYAGIDVSKDWLDMHVHPAGHSWRVENSLVGLRRLRQRLAGLVVAQVVLEPTGKHHRQAVRTLSTWGYRVAVVNPRRVRLFAEVCGIVAKTDRIDARLLALMGQSLDPQVRQPVAVALEQLHEWVNARDAAMRERVAISNRLQAASTRFLIAELQRRLKSLDTHIARLEQRIDAHDQRDLVGVILVSIPGIGKAVAAVLLAGLSEMGTCSTKAATLLAGLAPLADDSGKRQGQRHIRGGRMPVRNALYMAALSAARYNPDLKTTYRRLLAKGKAPKLALTAIMRKLVVLASTLITQNRPWSPTPPRAA